jgi:glycosyltransferase involved in cell wall biosynthesis
MSRWQARDLYFGELFSLADRVIAPSKYVHDFFRSREPCSVQLRLLEPCVFVSRESASGHHPSDGVLRAAFVGALVPHKGPHVILEALRIARPPSCDLVMFGSVPDSLYARRLRELVAAVPGVRLRLYGRYEPRDLPCLLRGVDCVIVPSLVPETFCFTLREALACGIPVLASRRGALPEAVTEGVNGRTFDPDEPAELGRLLLSLARDASLRQRLHDGARATRLTTPERHLDALLALYEETLAEAGRDDHRTALERVDVLHHRLRHNGFDVGD